MKVFAVTALVVLVVAAACEEETRPDPFIGCPNVRPANGAACEKEHAGMVCNYHVAGCGDYYPANCSADLRWQVAEACVPAGGAPPTGGVGVGSSVGASSASSAASSGTSGGSVSVGGAGGVGGGL